MNTPIEESNLALVGTEEDRKLKKVLYQIKVIAPFQFFSTPSVCCNSPLSTFSNRLQPKLRSTGVVLVKKRAL